MNTIDTISRPDTSVHGWGCTPTDPPPPSSPPRLWFRSWQRILLYVVLVALVVLVVANIALTLWIIAALRLAADRVGPIKIVRGGVRLEGQALALDRLVASSITSRPGQPITVHSYRNFSIIVTDSEQQEESKFVIKRDSITCGGRIFDVSDGKGRSVFRASREEVKVAADALVVDGPGGIHVKTAVQTAAVRAPPGSDLKLESQTRRLEVLAPQEIYIESRTGNIDISSHSDIKLVSVVGALKIDAQNIYMNRLRQAVPLRGAARPSSETRPVKIYQLCACADGKLFLAGADGACAVREDDDLCR